MVAIKKPEVVPTITFGQILVSGLLAVIIGGGYWIGTKDSNDKTTGTRIDQLEESLTEKIGGISTNLAGLGGKMDGLQGQMATTGTQVTLIDQRLKTAEDDIKDARTIGRSFQDQLNEVGSRVRVLESIKGR